MYAAIDGLASLPFRGSIPAELDPADGGAIRQLIVEGIRIIYDVTDGGEVTVFVIADGRRDLDGLLRLRVAGRAGTRGLQSPA